MLNDRYEKFESVFGGIYVDVDKAFIATLTEVELENFYEFLGEETVKQAKRDRYEKFQKRRNQ